MPFFVQAPVPPANLTGTPVSAAEGVPFVHQEVATFTSPDPSVTTSSFLATIDWGDSSPVSAGEITEDASHVFHVAGGHTYALPGTYTVTVTVVNDNGIPVSTTTAAAVVSPFVVTNTNDSGIGSLRFAIQAANADLDHDDTITFQIPTTDPRYDGATGSWTIPVGAGLTIAKPSSEGGQHVVVIDGLSQQSQPGAASPTR